MSKTIPVFDEATGRIIDRARKNADQYHAEIRGAMFFVRAIKCSDRLDNLRSFGVWPEERRRRYIRETLKYILPIAFDTDPWFAEEIGKYCV